MSPVAICGTDTPLDTPNPDVNYTALALVRRIPGQVLRIGVAGCGLLVAVRLGISAYR